MTKTGDEAESQNQGHKVGIGATKKKNERNDGIEHNRYRFEKSVEPKSVAVHPNVVDKTNYGLSMYEELIAGARSLEPPEGPEVSLPVESPDTRISVRLGLVL